MLPGIRKTLDEDSTISHKALKDQFEKLILQPLLGIKQARSRALARVVVIDALDECEREADTRAILQLLARTKDIRPVPLRIVVTSRPELHIRLGFREMPNGTYIDLVLHEVLRSKIQHDIRLFLEHELRAIQKDRALASDWPAPQQIMALVELAVPLFIYAATVCRYVGTKGGDPEEYLNKVLQYPKTAFSQLDRTYLPVLDQLLVEQEERDREDWLHAFRGLVGSIVILASPLPVSSLARLLQVPQKQVERRLDALHSVLSVPNREDIPIRLLHLSFREFLVDPQKQGKSLFWVDEKSTHKKLASRCLELMSGPSGLHQDMCSLSGPGVLRSEIDEQTVTSSLPPDLQYACRYWVDHLKQGQEDIVNRDTTHLFLQKHLLHWFEAMSLIRESNRCVDLLDSLQALASPSANLVFAFLHDAKRFVLRFQEEPSTTNFCGPSAREGQDVVYERSRLGRVSQHARGPFLYGLGGGLLARRAAGRVGIFGQDSTAVGGGDGDVSQHARGPFLYGLGGGLLARRAAGRVGIRRQDSTAVGGGDGDVSQHARGPFLYGLGGGLLARRAAGRVGIFGQDSTAVGGGDGDVSQHARGPFRRCQRGGLLARRAAGRVGIFGQDSTAVGGGDGDVSQHTQKPS
ncbi:hypothetical protein A1F95_09650 [Pyrenophora tritici-repentis]|nr:hypothetical protein A1F95_09650 [Pyrenophora tritici-repentis]